MPCTCQFMSGKQAYQTLVHFYFVFLPMHHIFIEDTITGKNTKVKEIKLKHRFLVLRSKVNNNKTHTYSTEEISTLNAYGVSGNVRVTGEGKVRVVTIISNTTLPTYLIKNEERPTYNQWVLIVFRSILPRDNYA